jgi:cytochrome bd-type quinol oxidase subunit 1
MSTAFVLGGLVVAGVFAFVYLQNKKKKEQGQSNNANNTGEGVVNPSFGITDDNSSSGTGGSTAPEYST